jgi:hypothetical protein
MNNNGKRTMGRFQKDNRQILYTDYGRYIVVKQGLAEYKVKIITNKKTGKRTKKRILVTKDVGALVDWLNKDWEQLYDPYISFYPPEIIKLYNDPVKKSPRSLFVSVGWYKRLAKYGHNRSLVLPNMLQTKIKSFMDETFYDYFTQQDFDEDLEEAFAKGDWLTHITTGSNSGYPYNVPQDKNWMYNVIRPRTVKLLQRFIKHGYKSIDWLKLLFSMGSRTERGVSLRVIMMAPAHEKPVGAKINTLIDTHLQDLPVPIPRVWGNLDRMAEDFIHTEGVYEAKDFEVFDTSVPIALLRILAEWFYNLQTLIGYLIAFELYLMIYGGMAVSETLAFLFASIPSGIGTTQIVGSIVHMVVDFLSGLLELLKKKVYQSDDTLGKGDFTESEIKKCIAWIEKFLKMKISPIGKKSLVSPRVGLVLQKILDDEEKIYYGHEARAHTNEFLREYRMNTDDALAVRLSIDLTNKKEKGNLLKIQGARSLLGNISSLGLNAPIMARYLYRVFGEKASSYNIKTINIAEQSLAEWNEAEHKLPMNNDWLHQFLDEASAQFGWNKVSTQLSIDKIEDLLHNYGRKINPEGRS